MMDQMGESRRKDIKDAAKSLSLSSWKDGVQAAEKAAGTGCEKSRLVDSEKKAHSSESRARDRTYRAIA